MKKILIVVAVVAAVSFVGYRVVAGLVGGEAAPELQLAEVTRGDLENTVSSTGTIEAKGTVQIGTQVSGTIAEVYVDFNDRVHEGDLLARLDPAVLENQVLQAEANVERAEAQLTLNRDDAERNRSLFERGLISESTVEASDAQLKLQQAELKSAKASLNQARTNLGYATIRSPIDGTVISRDVEAGQTVAASLSTPELFVIAEDLDRVEIHALVDESDIGQVHDGMPVRFTVQAYPDDEFTGTVTQVRLQPETVQNVVNYTVVVEADNAEGILLPGMTATVDFIIDRRDDVLLVPNSALRFQPTEKMVASLGDKGPRGQGYRPRPAGGPPPSQAGPPLSASAPPAVAATATGDETERPADRGRVWVVTADGSYEVVPLRTGVTDGRLTEVVRSQGLEEGMTVITGSTGATVAAAAASGNSSRRGGPPHGPRLF